MIKYKIFSNAKINIGLNVFQKEDDGYHNIDSIMIPIDLSDEMDITFYSELGDLKIKSEAKGFFEFIKIRIIARELGITTIKQDKENRGRILINFDEKKINVDKIIYLLSNKKIMYSKFTRTIGYNGDIFEFFKLYSS